MARLKQYAERVNVLKYVKSADDWAFRPVVERNGRIIRDHVTIEGRDEHHPEGTYYLEWREGGKRRRQSIPQFEDVVTTARRKALELSAIKNGLLTKKNSVDSTSGQIDRLAMGTAIDQYLEFIKAHRSLNTYRSYRYTLDTLLRNSYTKTYVDQVSRDDMLKFMADCYKGGLSDRTVYDKLVVVLQLFKRHSKTGIVDASDWPEYVETIRPIYEPEEIEMLLRHAEPDEAVFMKFLLASGFRDREVRHVLWRDVDFRNSLVRVVAKPRWGFVPKNHEERAVPLPTALINQLRKLKESRNALPSELVFPNSKGNPDSENDMIPKRVAERAKLNCGQCETEHGNKCSKGPHCQHFFLHKFRHTFATEHLRYGVDIRTLQAWMGHREIQSTMVYLKGVHSKDALAKVNAGSLAAYMS
jgi:integrase